jgi:aspartyl-tRNA(Asn)/glutamyl-tRNA(Gln) amidotransferase subunit A
MDRYRFATIPELIAALRTGEVSVAELAVEASALLDRDGRTLNALATLLPERAGREADAAQRRLKNGAAPALCGIPYGAKDLLAAVGAPTTWGSRHFADQTFVEDAVAVARLRRAGAVLVAKLAMSELAGGGRPMVSGASAHGSGRNPWDLTRYSGGSSSGSAAAVAAGLLPYALGSETTGSIVGPAAFCGVTGIRPTYGLVPRTGTMTLSWTLDKVGVLARTADDVGTVLAAIAGRHHSDPTSTGTLHAGRLSPERLRSIRVAFMPDELTECGQSTATALAAGVREFGRVVPGFVEAGLSRTPPYASAAQVICVAEGAVTFREHLENPDFRMTDAQQQAHLTAGLQMPAPDYIAALRVRDAAIADAKKLFRQADVLLSVCRPTSAPMLDLPRERGDHTRSDAVRGAANLAGLPGVAFPCGIADDGLPIGLHLVGPPGSDMLLLALAAAYQRETNHHLRHPPAVPADNATGGAG